MQFITFLIGLTLVISIGWADILLDPSLVCKRTRKLRGKLAEICRNESTSNILKEIINGINLGFRECEFQFNNHRWNCTTLQKSMRKILMKDIRETSFVNAITSAGITYSIARACSTGKLVECSCDRNYNSKEIKKSIKNNQNSNIKIDSDDKMFKYLKKNQQEKITNNKWDNNSTLSETNQWQWGGCGDNLKFGIRTSKIFLDSRYKKRSDIHTLVRLHNNQAGRLAIKNNLRIDCKCHGLSGSCTVKTCWSKMSSFHEIGSYIKMRFNNAIKVIANNDGNSFVPEKITVKKPSKYDLVYTENSPDFCEANSKTGSLGTTGRKCNSTLIGANDCEILCCGRGYTRHTIIQTISCNCIFKWCCEVSCSTCREKTEINICK